ncbi:MAG: hypothetical protein OXU26_14830 [Acidobacteriota bacterium]|nr:hypothetical protein [Acidobacteriota bacterium]MDE2965182.1 hypothetical protein [Acidobacteriota bacterium]
MNPYCSLARRQGWGGLPSAPEGALFGGFENRPLVGNAGKKQRHYILKSAPRQYQFAPIFLGLFLAETWPGICGVLLKSSRFKQL